jgi:predicted peptidase
MKYKTIAEVYDLGPFISKVILEPEQPLGDCSLERDTFQVYVKRKDKKTGEILKIRKTWTSDEVYPSEGEREVNAVYISDEEGRFNQRGSYITLVLEVDPRIALGATIAFDGTINVQVDCDYTITQIKPILIENRKIENMVFTELHNQKTILADELTTDKLTYQGIQLGYAAHEPKKNGTKRPLLIWLHGAGEGGTDPIIAASGNKVVNLLTEDIQQYLGGSYVLVPQAPTMWMDDGTGQYNTDGRSMYVESLKNLIDDYMAGHKDIDEDRVYIGGCSNGGFMTMKMIIAYPHMFAAAYPICEALADEFVSDNDLNGIKNLPIWFTHAANDPIVNVEKHTEATYHRLIHAGASKVHFSCFPSVTDRTGCYVNEDRTPYEYNGHFSWIPALNNECILDYNNKLVYIDGKNVSLFEWLGKQKRNR